MKTKVELAKELYHKKIKYGEALVPVGRKSRLTETEFVKRYLNGVGGAPAFKKDELVLLNKAYDEKLAKKAVKKTTTCKAPARKTVAKRK